jgi:L-cystine uptake protein TcyP (sodium:dicarboxylate symporter family)
MAKQQKQRKKIGFAMLIIIGLLLGLAIKHVAIGLIIGLVFGLLASGMVSGKREEE